MTIAGLIALLVGIALAGSLIFLAAFFTLKMKQANILKIIFTDGILVIIAIGIMSFFIGLYKLLKYSLIIREEVEELENEVKGLEAEVKQIEEEKPDNA